jgi:O-antigen ligase
MTPQSADLRGTTLTSSVAQAPVPAAPVAEAPASQAPVFQRTADPAKIPAPNLVQRVGYWFLVAYLFIALSRVLDNFGQIRIPAFLYVGLGVMAILSGGLLNIFRTGVGRTMIYLFFWCGLAIPFSTWMGGSVVLFPEVAKAFFLGAAIIAISRTTKDTVRLLYVFAAALLLASILVWFYGHLDLGRLTMLSGTYADPNQFAMALLMALPFWIALATQAPSKVGRVLAYVATIPIVIAFLRTGSRGALFGFCIMLLFAFFGMSMKARAVLVGTVVTLFVLALLALPNYILARYLTIFTEQQSIEFTADEQKQFVADVGSSFARWGLLMDSVTISLEHPIFGVGMGQFPEQNWQRKKLAGKPNAGYAALVTHNTYTQFSSESGIPAMILYIVLLVQCYRSLGKIKRMPNVGAPVQSLRLAFVVLTCCGFFLAVAYSQVFYILAGITARLYMTVLAENPVRQFHPMAHPLAALGQKVIAQPVVAQPQSVPEPVAATKGLPPRNKLSPWRTNSSSNYVRNSRIS